MIVVLGGEGRDQANFERHAERLKREFAGKFWQADRHCASGRTA